MDQDSFRQLLSSRSSTSKASASNTLGGGTRQRGSLLASQPSSSKTKPEAGATASFQPHKVKKTNANADYRDRAAERRSGIDHEFTHVETLLNDFEERNKGHDKSVVDEQRKYLGGDSEHSVLVKGLDFALLEQNKAKAAVVSNVEDDEALEQAFLGVGGSTSTDVVEAVPQPKKKSRQKMIHELKEKRERDEQAENKAADAGIEEAKKAGKFKPIGFKPIDGDSEGKKRKKEKEGGEKKKKKRKVEEVKEKPAEAPGSTQSSAPLVPAALPEKGKQPEPEPEPLDPDFDIFAGVEEYAGEIEDDDETEDKHPIAEDSQEPQPDVDWQRRGWFDEPKSPTPPPREPTPPAEEPSETKDEEMEGEPASVRLAPLASSISVKDVLAIDDAVAKEEKRKARKEKKKKKAELNAEGKVNRDYQKLMAYERKKSK
ncbi:hypothetical protein BDM02DRAFT_1512192 [Thelephora ganbajun]|uniref:Uncharacterized protein n=1 Tax=Thelephora ganbajun TaxID=370292 RepID=A0ACB6ZKQ8_THEGA|nr:hypothetical protein BDM02DRAFT_1512192 [Thelephora ganbajun]